MFRHAQKSVATIIIFFVEAFAKFAKLCLIYEHVHLSLLTSLYGYTYNVIVQICTCFSYSFCNPSKSEVIGRCGGDEKNEPLKKLKKIRPATILWHFVYVYMKDKTSHTLSWRKCYPNSLLITSTYYTVLHTMIYLDNLIDLSSQCPSMYMVYGSKVSITRQHKSVTKAMDYCLLYSC